MKLRNNQAGFSVFELILLVLVLGALAAVTLRVLDNHSKAVNSSTTATTASTTKSVSDVSSAPVVNKASDLNKAEDTLNQNDPTAANQADSNQLDGQLSNLN
jgi:guanyl-specific ribonuclease Sa